MSRRRAAFTGSLRFRLTAIATAVVAIVLAATAIALVNVQHRQLTENLDASLEQRADTLTRELRVDIPVAPFADDGDDRAVQLVDADGMVLASSANLVDTPALPNRMDASDQQHISTRNDLPLEDDEFRVLSRRIDTPAGEAVLHLAENIDDLDEAVADLTLNLIVALPLVVGLLAALIWWLTGRALRPVESIRSTADEITATTSERRVPVPDSDDEIRRLAVTMNRMLERLDLSADRQRRFVADAAHELRTPLTRIRTDVEVDIARPDRADPAATNARVRDEVVGLQLLLDDLLHLARADAGVDRAGFTPVDLDDIVLAEIRAQRDHTDITVDGSGVSAAHLQGNADHLARAVRNLLSNAVRHATSTVTVTLSERREGIELKVADDGPGVAREDRHRIFERFARVDDARTRTDGGTGLGLAITKGIVEGHGGTVTYDDSGPGACFVVSIPRLHVTA